ncbi:hypothetical protein CVD28_10260 [Bacillus sp. M6-12]|nr:hypothetical protein CVD28_10260 [Bacillus sp. M6-12]
MNFRNIGKFRFSGKGTALKNFETYKIGGKKVFTIGIRFDFMYNDMYRNNIQLSIERCDFMLMKYNEKV